MIHFRVLGPLELKGSGGEDVLSVLSQPKRIALLAYLALTTLQGFQRRDTLVGLFWPELDQERARAALRKALYFLRKSLGEEIFSIRTEEEVAVNWSLLTCDAVDFERALREDNPQLALDLYRGDLLEGVFPSDCAEFEKWLDDQRERFRESAAGAAWALAHRYLRSGHITDGERMGQRALSLVPTDEHQVRGFVAALHGAGDRASAVRFYEKFARILEDTLGLEPAAETQALVLEMRDTLGGQSLGEASGAQLVAPRQLAGSQVPGQPLQPPVPDPVSSGLQDRAAKGPVHGLPSLDYATQTLDSTLERSEGRSRSWSLPRLAAGVLLVLAASSAVLLGRGRGPGQPPGMDATGEIVLAIMPFSIQGPDSIQWMREGMVTLLSTILDDVGGVRTVDRNRLLEAVGHLDAGARLPLEEAQETARRLGATHFILGDGVAVGGERLTLATTLYTVGAGPGYETEVRVDGSLADPPGLVDSLLRPVLGGLQVAAGRRLSGTAALTTDSTAALRAFLKGEEDFRGTRYAEAYDAFDEAVKIDETFALAHYRKSVAAVLDLKFDQAHLAADRAWEYSSRLTSRDRRLLQAWDALLGGSADRAERLYEGILEDYPDEVEAHFGLGSVLVYFNPVRGRPIGEAELHFQRVLELMPSFGQARFHLLEFATVRRDQGAFDSLLRGVDLESDQALAWGAVRAFGWGSSEAQERIKARVRTATSPEAGLAVARIAAFLHAYTEAEVLASLLTGSDRDSDTRCAARILMAMMRFARGRWDDGMTFLRETEECNYAWATELQALFTRFPLRTPSREELMEARGRLLDWEAGQAPPSTNFVLFAHNRFHLSLRWYLLALVSVWAGEQDQALRYVGDLRTEGHSQELRAVNLAWADAIRARVAAAQGNAEEAVRLLEDSRPAVHVELVSISPFFSRSFDRFLLGELLLSLGRDDRALDWFKTLTEGHELVLVAPAFLEMARILEARGDIDAARPYYARFAEIWKDADPGFQPLLEEARKKALTPTMIPR